MYVAFPLLTFHVSVPRSLLGQIEMKIQDGDGEMIDPSLGRSYEGLCWLGGKRRVCLLNSEPTGRR